MQLSGNISREVIHLGGLWLTSNFILYVLYLLPTAAGIRRNTGKTLLYSKFVKYLSIYSPAYVLNRILLLLSVDNLGFPHQIVHEVMITSA